MQAIWDMLSDKKIWSLLGNVHRNIDQDISRLLFIELFSRIKTIEEENLALKIYLMEEGLVDRELLDSYRQVVKEFIEKKEDQEAVESDFFAHSGIPFPEWVNFKLSGKFGNNMEKEN